MPESPSKPRFLNRISRWLRQPEWREELFEVLHAGFENNLMDADSLAMMEGVLQVARMQVRDIMVPHSKMQVVDISTPFQEFLPHVIATAHSRFPVIDGDKHKVIGILLAKDLLRHYTDNSIEIRDMLRPVVFVPEAKYLNVLLKDFKAKRNHIAIVVDEYGGVAGMVTIEDVLEQIVGDIEDEYDYDENEGNIVQNAAQQYRVKAQTQIEDVNTALKISLNANQFSTIGGLVMQAFGRLPKNGEEIVLDNLKIKVLRADSRRLYSLLIDIIKADA